jgi:hypothetical protein
VVHFFFWLKTKRVIFNVCKHLNMIQTRIEYLLLFCEKIWIRLQRWTSEVNFRGTVLPNSHFFTWIHVNSHFFTWFHVNSQFHFKNSQFFIDFTWFHVNSREKNSQFFTLIHEKKSQFSHEIFFFTRMDDKQS